MRAIANRGPTRSSGRGAVMISSDPALAAWPDADADPVRPRRRARPNESAHRRLRTSRVTLLDSSRAARVRPASRCRASTLTVFGRRRRAEVGTQRHRPGRPASASRSPATACTSSSARRRHAARGRQAERRRRDRARPSRRDWAAATSCSSRSAPARSTTALVQRASSSQATVTGLKYGLIIALAALGPVADLRHHRADELRPRRAHHLRRHHDLRLQPWPRAAGHRGRRARGRRSAALFGWAQDRILWRPLRNRGTGLIAMMIVSIGFALLLRSVYQYIFGGSTHTLVRRVRRAGAARLRPVLAVRPRRSRSSAICDHRARRHLHRADAHPAGQGHASGLRQPRPVGVVGHARRRRHLRRSGSSAPP